MEFLSCRQTVIQSILWILKCSMVVVAIEAVLKKASMEWIFKEIRVGEK
jgi:hypothetical protein